MNIYLVSETFLRLTKTEAGDLQRYGFVPIRQATPLEVVNLNFNKFIQCPALLQRLYDEIWNDDHD